MPRVASAPVRGRDVAHLAILLVAVGALSGCISVKSYVDPELPKVGYADLLVRRDKRPIRLSLEFQRNGERKASLSKTVAEKARTILATANIFSLVEVEGAQQPGEVDTLQLTLDNLADVGDAIVKGMGTGFTFGGVGSRVTDAYVLNATFTRQGSPPLQKTYRHALHSAIGNADLPPGVTRMSVQQAFDRVLEDLLLKLIRDLQGEEVL